MTNYEIALLLIDATKNCLISGVKDWLVHNHPQSKLTFRVGTGKRTYCSSKRSSKDAKITYGVKMIESCLYSERKSSGWTHGKEILKRGYFEKKITPQTILTAVLIHETAHYFQMLANKVYDGSIHNEEFYEILDRMHFRGTAQKVYDYLMEDESFKNLKFEVVESYKNEFCKNDFIKGDYFYFKSKNKGIVLDVVLKANPKKIITPTRTLSYSLVTEKIDDISAFDSSTLPVLPKFNNKNVCIGDKILVDFDNKQLELTISLVKERFIVSVINYTRYTIPYRHITQKL
jgi:hypothetical protein